MRIHLEPGDQPLPEVSESRLRALLQAIFAREGRSLELSFLICGDERMSEIHEHSHGDPETTDVIAFDLSGDGPPAEAGEDLDGEIVINAELAARMGAELGHGAEAELLFYAAHGVLHLLGWEDGSDGERQAMHDRQRECLRAIGVEVAS